MKALAISLHRLGDLIMHGHILKAWSEQEAVAIHLLAHPFWESINFLFPFVSEAHIFERNFCQHSIGEDHFNKNWPFNHIKELLFKLNAQNFEQLIDLSQTDTSSRWVTFINAKKKTGVCYDATLRAKKFCSDNQAIRYIHNVPRSAYHFIDLFKSSLSLSFDRLPTAFPPKNRDRLILFQTQSSDPKKNWPVKKWHELIERTASEFPSHKLLILASSSEYKVLCNYFNFLPESCSVICTSMLESYNLLKTACLLVSLDTAMKHLASWSQTPVIEIATGSSSPFETGTYQEGALILTAKVACYPCHHSANCSQSDFLCHRDITVDSVLAAIRFRLAGQTEECLKTIFSVYQSRQGLWSMQALIPNKEDTHARRHQEPTQNHY